MLAHFCCNFYDIMKVFKKYILPFLILYFLLTAVMAGCVYWMTTQGYAPMEMSEFQFVIVFLAVVLVAVSIGFIVMNRDKNVKAVYTNVSKQPLLVVCVGEGLYGANSLMTNLFDGLLLDSFIVIFPLLLYVLKTTHDIKESLS